MDWFARYRAVTEPETLKAYARRIAGELRDIRRDTERVKATARRLVARARAVKPITAADVDRGVALSGRSGRVASSVPMVGEGGD